jgi:hypothetical protein
VATALGHVGADILSVDIVERTTGYAIDDLVLDLPPGKLADSLVTAALTVADVRVDSIRPYAGQIDPHRELEFLDSLAARPENPRELLAEGVHKIFRAGWALALGAPIAGIAPVVAASAAAPQLSELAVPWWPAEPARVVEPDASWAPSDWVNLGTELAVAPLADGALLVGRPAPSWLPGELMRLNHLVGIAASVIAVTAVTPQA